MRNKDINDLSGSLSILVDEIARINSFILPDHEYSFNRQKLIQQGFIKVHDDKLTVLEKQELLDTIYNKYKAKFKFKLSTNFQDYAEFYQKIKADLQGEKHHINGSFNHLRNLLSSLISKANHEKKVTFESYTLSLRKNDDEAFIYDFNSAFSKSLPLLKIPNKALFKILKHLYGEFEDVTVTYNGNTGVLTQGVRAYCKENPHLGINLLTSFLKSRKVENANLVTSILAGLYDWDKEVGRQKLMDLANDDFHATSVAIAISIITPENEKEVTQLLDIVESIKSKDIAFLGNSARVYVRNISNDQNKDAINQRCKAKLLELISSDQQFAQQCVLQELRYLDGFDDIVFEIISEFASRPIPGNLFFLIDHVLARFSSISYFFEFLVLFSQNNPVKFKSKTFETSIYKLKNDNPQLFSEGLISLLIHPNGPVRYTGHQILSHFTIRLDNDAFSFDCDISKLSGLDQYKLWVSVLQNNSEPRRSLPMLIPLLDSKEKVVVQILLFKIESLIDDYAGSVIETLEHHLPKKHKAVLVRMKTKLEEFHQYWEAKNKVREFNPLYTQSELFNKYNELSDDRFNVSMTENIKDQSLFMSLVTNVILAKGGGWKHSQKESVAKLSTISASFQLPRQYYISPERYDFDRQIDYTEDWNEKFKGWGAIK